MDLAGIPLADLLTRDTKEFELSDRKVLISQVLVPSFSWNRERSALILAELAAVQSGTKTDIVIALFTSVMDNASEVYGAADEPLLQSLFGNVLPSRFDGVMSRKNDFLPWLGKRLRDLS